MAQDAAPDDALALEHALALAYVQLNRRERTRHELREHLVSRDVKPEVVEQALDELTEQGYVSDERFARLFAQDKGDLDQWGSDRIRRGLLARGVPVEIVQAVLEPGAGADEMDRAVSLLTRRFPAGLTDRRESDRALGILLRKGYEYDLAVEALSAHRRGMGLSGPSQAA